MLIFIREISMIIDLAQQNELELLIHRLELMHRYLVIVC